MANKVDAKVVLLGKNYSGKTCLFQRYLHGGYDGRRMETIAAAFGAKNEVIDERSLTLGIWDTAGSERYESMSRIYYRGARAAIICYDLTDSSSFDKVKFWVKELQTHEENCKIYLCGTKLDLVMKDQNMRKVDYHFTTDYANEIHAKLFETSSLEGDNICQLFHDIAKTCLEDQQFETYMEAEPALILEAPNKRKKCSCR